MLAQDSRLVDHLLDFLLIRVLKALQIGSVGVSLLGGASVSLIFVQPQNDAAGHIIHAVDAKQTDDGRGIDLIALLLELPHGFGSQRQRRFDLVEGQLFLLSQTNPYGHLFVGKGVELTAASAVKYGKKGFWNAAFFQLTLYGKMYNGGAGASIIYKNHLNPSIVQSSKIAAAEDKRIIL